MTTGTPRHRVLLVGPWRTDRAGGGCCSATPAAIGAEEPHVHADPSGEPGPGTVLAALRAAAPEDEVELVHPRNTAYLVPAVVRDARNRGDGWFTALRSAVTATTAWTLVVDGRVISRGLPLTPDGAAAAAALARH